jgi:hypothetical protein
MEAFVLNVSNWIGWHIAEALLEEGYKVKGLRAEENGDHLMDFFARNSNFEEITALTGDHPLGICVGSIPDELPIDFEYLFLLNGESEALPEAIHIHAPYLFGEWMPMTKEKMFAPDGEEIAFASALFQEKAIYIGDFLPYLLRLIENPPETNNIYLTSSRKKQGEILENCFPVRENGPIEEKMEQVLTHYERFADIYPQM